MEKTLIVLKPDAVHRQLVGQILGRFEQKGLKIVGMKMVSVSDEMADRMYSVHKGKDFHPQLVEFMTSSPVVAVVLQGKDAINVTRSMIGPTFGPDAPAGTIRGDFGMSRRYNLIHASDAPESAEHEMAVFFQPGELQNYELRGERWIYARNADELI